MVDWWISQGKWLMSFKSTVFFYTCITLIYLCVHDPNWLIQNCAEKNLQIILHRTPTWPQGSSWLIPSRLKGPLNINEGSASTSTRGDRLPRLSPIQLTSQEATGDESGDPVKLGSVLLKTRQFNVDHGWGFIWLYFVGGSFQHWLHLPQVRSNESWFLEIHSHWHPWPRHWVQWCCCFRILGCTVYWRGMRITPASKHWQSIWW